MSAATQRPAKPVGSGAAPIVAVRSRGTNSHLDSAQLGAATPLAGERNRRSSAPIVDGSREHPICVTARSTGAPKNESGGNGYLSATVSPASNAARLAEGSTPTTSSPTARTRNFASISTTGGRSALSAIGRRRHSGGAGTGSSARASDEIAAKRLSQEVLDFGTAV